LVSQVRTVFGVNHPRTRPIFTLALNSDADDHVDDSFDGTIANHNVWVREGQVVCGEDLTRRDARDLEASHSEPLLYSLHLYL